MSYKEKDWYVYCDICGQRSLASKSSKLSHYTGRDGLLVCRHDVDGTDYGLMPFVPRREQNVDFIRINHTNTDDGSPIVDLESMSLCYYLASSQDNVIITDSQDSNVWITTCENL